MRVQRAHPGMARLRARGPGRSVGHVADCCDRSARANRSMADRIARYFDREANGRALDDSLPDPTAISECLLELFATWMRPGPRPWSSVVGPGRL